MRLQPIVYTTRMDGTVDWYRAVLGVDPAVRSDMWTAFPVGDATLGIHFFQDPIPTSGRIHLSLVASDALEVLIDRLEAAGIAIESGIQEQPFGRSFLVRDPEGNPVQINELGSR